MKQNVKRCGERDAVGGRCADDTHERSTDCETTMKSSHDVSGAPLVREKEILFLRSVKNDHEVQ